MQPAVNSRRVYDGSRRQAQARQTRAAVLTAARELFLRHGYAATTVAAIADDAGVSVETVYKNFKNKPGVAKACFDVAVVGDDEPVPMLERELVGRTHAEPDPKKKLLGFGAHLAESMPRAGPIQLLIRDAAASDPGAAALLSELMRERAEGMSNFARHLKESRSLRKGVSFEEACDVLFTFLAPEIWDLLVNQRGWSNARFGKWVGQQLVAALT